MCVPVRDALKRFLAYRTHMRPMRWMNFIQMFLKIVDARKSFFAEAALWILGRCSVCDAIVLSFFVVCFVILPLLSHSFRR